MFLKSIHPRGFRNLRDEPIEFSPTFNLIFGKNAQGKTNLIEAVALIASGRSFRTSEFREMISSQREWASVEAVLSGRSGDDRVLIHMDQEGKRMSKNDKRVGSAKIPGLAAVVFAPEEILLLREAPSVRRRYIDHLISSISEKYRKNISRYEKVILQRNRLFKEALQSGREPVGIEAWDDQLISFGSTVVLDRMEFCHRLNGILPDRYRAFAPQDGEARLEYMPQCGTDILAEGREAVAIGMSAELQRRKDDGRIRGASLVGPHRDDFEAKAGALSLKQGGSQGQQRSFLLAMKLTELKIIEEVTGERPIILLDDVASELDSQRSALLVKTLEEMNGQLFVTAVDLARNSFQGVTGGKSFEIEEGRIL